MVIKIDLEKADDRLEWSFVRMVLDHFGFPKNVFELILSCISTTSTSILFNGNKLEAFYPSRGIRQGDPMSPYIFLLCMEYLSSLISKSCESKDWTTMKASQSGPRFSHFFFADDLLLFAKANAKNSEAILGVLDKFCEISGQKISKSKSRVVFSPNVDAHSKLSICNKLGISATSEIGRYLGFPIFHKGQNCNAFNFVIDKVQSKLAGWKAKVISPVGRLVLIKSASSTIPDYYMQ